MFSYWEQESFWKKPDVVIIGSGIVGLNAAIAIKEKAPSLDIRIVERGLLPYGASTRNAGFACFGSMTELLADLTNRPLSEVISLIGSRWEGLNDLRKTLGDDALGYEPLGGNEIFLNGEDHIFENAASYIEVFNKELESALGLKQVFISDDRKLNSCGFRGIKHLIRNTAEGQLDTGKMMSALIDLATSKGIRIHTGVTVSRVEESEKEMALVTPEGFMLRCNHVLLATNGMTGRLANGLDVQPARAQVLITEPIYELQFQGSFHYQQGYYYFRNVGNRILFGGARNIDFKKEATDEFGITVKIQDKLDEFL
ncbi:MAG: NAD(P)/FAD-dependent oxidoreductase, partial [Bacteroidota bacterium]